MSHRVFYHEQWQNFITSAPMYRVYQNIVGAVRNLHKFALEGKETARVLVITPSTETAQDVLLATNDMPLLKEFDEESILRVVPASNVRKADLSFDWSDLKAIIVIRGDIILANKDHEKKL